MTEVDHELVAIVEARVGQSVCGGKYTIDRVLGIGGMAAVYAGTHRNGRSIAMKLLHPEYSRRADIRKRFVREGQAANAVAHRGVVAVIDDDVTEDGAAFLVMERLEGKTLEQLWEELDRRLPTRAVLAIGRELCEVLAVAHRSGIIHRDLKPENLFLTYDGELKVLDFGLAHVRDAARPTETQTGMVFGTPAFMPPEQASGQTSKIDARTDLWAVGATMFTLLSGELVHQGETAQHFVMLAATEPARSLAVAMPNAHPALVALVDRALAREREARWQSAESMREAIVTLSEMLLGEPETPLMTPLALTEAAAARRGKARPKPATSSEETLSEETLSDKTLNESTRKRAVVVPIEDSGETLEERTRVGVPEFAVTSDPDTQPDLPDDALEKLPRLGGGPSDTPPEGMTSDDLRTEVRASRDSSRALLATTENMQRHAGWSDLRQAVESAEPHTQVRRPSPMSPIAPSAPIAEHPFDRTALMHSTPAGGFAHARAAPPSSSHHAVPSFVPQDRTSHPALVPIPRTARRTVHTRAPRSLVTTYLPLAAAVLFLFLSPLGYFVARSCAREPPPVVLSAPSAFAPASAMVSARPPPPVASISSAVTSSAVTSATSAPAPALPPNPYIAPSTREAPRAPSPPVDCSTPFTVDDAGVKHPRLECFDPTMQRY